MKNVEDIYPLSPLQQGMLFHSLLSPESGVYINQCCCTLRGDLDTERFRDAWQTVVDRHPVLRSAFLWEKLEQPLQAVRQQVRLPWRELDWRDLEPGDAAARIDELKEAERHEPFALAKAPLMRFVVVRLEDDRYEFLWTFHHILLDGWSTPLLLRELLAVYAAGREGAALPPARPYRDYIAWLERQDMAAAEAFWRHLLAGFSSPTPLGIDRPGAAEAGAAVYEDRHLTIPAEVTARLQALASRHRVTLNVATLGAWALLLSHYSGEDDVLFGGVVSGRPAELPGVESILGLFINTLPVRVEVPAGETAPAWLRALQERQLAARQFEFSPLAKVQKWSDVPPGAPLFESLFVFENYPVGQGQLAGGESMAVRVERVENLESTNYPLTLALSADREIFLRATYDHGRFEDSAVERLLGHLSNLLAGMADATESPLSALPVLSEAERQQLAAWNDTRTGYDLDRTLHGLIEEQVDRAPNATAVVFEGAVLTYSELDTVANGLAHRLLALGCGPESRVGVLMERSIEMVASLLGILKAGAAYVPLDPEHPAERLAFQTENAGLAAVLAQPRLADLLPGAGAHVLLVGPQDLAAAGRPGVRVDPENPAYVLYTSGSTGKPKGVSVPHRGIVNRLLWMQDAYRLTPADRVLQKTPFSFDVSVWEFFWPLLTGARLVVAMPGGHRDNAYLARLINEQGITVLHFVPSMLQLFVEEAAAAGPSLRDVMASGEALPPELADRFLERLPGARLHNLYGPTEASVDVTAWTCERGAERRSVPIGLPIANTRIHLLDPWMRPVPLGVTGDLYIAGVNLARGYVNRPDLTAERFVPDPEEGRKGERLYRTGDLARRRQDGAIEYVGRTDHQVKVRGFRIELGEIEAVLAAQPGIREAAVAVRQRADGHRSLVAYVVAAGEPAPGTDELRAALGRELPDYMVPSRFLLMPELPLNANGKLDRKALAAVEAAQPETPTASADPEGPEETALAGVWAAVLGVGRVGRDDNFFALGGDSILSLRVLSEMRKLGMELSLQQIFQHPTVRALASQLRRQEPEAAAVPLTAPFSLISEEDRSRLPEEAEDAFPLAMLQAGMVFHTEHSPTTAAYHDIFTYRLRAPFDGAALGTALDRLVERHPILRTSFSLVGYREPLQIVHRSAPAPLTIDDLCGLTTEEQESALREWTEAEKRRPFEWTRPPLLRVHVHRLREDQLQLSLSFHHSILDGWSIATLLAELFGSYLSLLGRATGPEPATPRLTYREFVAAERRAMESQESAVFWAVYLAESSSTQLPRWPGYPSGLSRQVRLPTTLLDSDTSDGLKALAREAGASLKSVLVAAYMRLLSLWSGERRVTTGLISNGRPEDGDGERMLGLFLNAVPFRLDLPGGTWTGLVRQAFQAETELLPHRRVPLAELQRRLGGHTLFETSFTYVSFHVLERLSEIPEIQVLGGESFEETNFALSVNFSYTASTGRVGVGFDYDASLLDPEQAQWIADSCLAVLAAMASSPGSRYEKVPLLPVAERDRLLAAGEGGEALAVRSCAHRLFEQRAQESPDATAVVAEGSRLTYRELDQRANQVARALQMWGVSPEVPVGICTRRAPGMVAGMLAVWKAGGAYLPLDPAYPADRLRYMVEDAQADVLVTTDEMLDRLPAGLEALSLVRLDTDTWLIDTQSDEPLPDSATPEDLAYVLYTSGSTGQPKGVMVPHGGLGNLAAAQARAFGVPLGSRVLQFAALSFDASVSEILMALLNGAELHLASDEQRMPGPGLMALLAERRITHLTVPPSALAAFPEAELPDLSTLVVAGEACPPELAQRWSRGRRFINAYGPTEATVCATTAEISGESARLPIGRPIAGVRARVLDPYGQLSPVGVPGELVVGGSGLARGYVGLPELTAMRFVPDAFDAAGGRLYRTGDLTRWLPDGNLDFLGRLDHQVKIRGFRIETGEIEAQLARHAAVRSAAVLAREDNPGDRRLVAYLLLTAESGEEQKEAAEADPALLSTLRDHLRGALPEHMIPSAFVVLPAFPLTPSGKVDRRALPAPDRLRPAQAKPFAAPRNPAEETVARIWSEVLSLDRVGIDDNFFDIGGHSLLATQIALRLTEAFGVEVTVKSLFDTPTIATLVTAILQKKAEEVDAETVSRLLSELEHLSDEELEARLAMAAGQPEQEHLP